MQRTVAASAVVLAAAFAGLYAFQVARTRAAESRADAAETALRRAEDAVLAAKTAEQELREAELRRMRGEAAKLQEMADEARRKLAVAEDAEKRRTQRTPEQPAPIAPKPGVGVAIAGPDRAKAFMKKMMENPGLRKQMREQQKVMLDMMYGGLFEALGYTGDDLAKLKELLVDRQMADMEAGFRPEEGSEGAAKRDEAEAAIRSFLGEAGYATYREHHETLGERMELKQFRTQAPDGMPALDPRQESEMTKILKEERQAVLGEARTAPPAEPPADGSVPVTDRLAEHIRRQEEGNRRVAERSQVVLTPAQQEAFVEYQRRQVEMMRLGLLFNADIEVAEPAEQK